MSDLVLNLTDTVSEGSSSVYKRLPLPLGFLPVPFAGSPSLIFSQLATRLPLLPILVFFPDFAPGR